MSKTLEQLKKFTERLNQSSIINDSDIDLFNAEIWQFRHTYNPIIEQFSDKALKFANHNGYGRGRAVAMHNSGWFYIISGQNLKAEKYLQESLEIFQDLQDDAALASTVNGLATAKINAGDHQTALANYFLALRLKEKIGDYSGAAVIMNNLGSVAARLGDYSLSLDYFYRALQIKIDSREISDQALFHCNLSYTLSRVGELTAAVEHSQNALNFYRDQPNARCECLALVNSGAPYQSRGEHQTALARYHHGFEIAEDANILETQAEAQMRIGSVYYDMRDYQTALIYLTEALRISQSINSLFYECETLLWLGLTYKQKGDLQRSLDALMPALHLAKTLNANDLLGKTHLALSDTYEAQHKLSEALFHHQAFHQIWQDIFGTTALRQISLLMLKQELKNKPGRKSKLAGAPRQMNKATACDQPNIALSPRKLQEITNFVARNLEHNLTLANLSDIVGLSQNYFLRSFKQTTGKTPHQFIVEQRVAQAKILLQTTDLPLTEIALRCGFSSQSHLTTHFRLLNGTTPSQFKRSYRLKPSNKS